MSGVAIVIPCFNESSRLNPSAIHNYISANPDTCFVLVNDGSTDCTGELLHNLETDWPRRIATLTLPSNQGKAEAVRQGVLMALKGNPEFVGFWDADLATPLAEINRFREVFQEQPTLALVMGSRVRLLGRCIQRSAVRHYFGRVFATFASLALAMPVYDTQCGAKLFRVTPEVQTVFTDRFHSRWVFDVEILARLRRTLLTDRGADVDQSIYEVPLRSWQDVRGSKLHLWQAICSVWHLARIWLWRLHCDMKMVQRRIGG